MVRRVRPEVIADRVAVLAVHECRECARLALQAPIGTAGWMMWLKKHHAGGGLVPPNRPCVEHTGRRQASSALPIGGDPAAPAHMEEPEYVKWLQETLAKERLRANRLKGVLVGVRRTLDRAIEETKRDQSEMDDLARALAGRRIIKKPRRLLVAEGGEALGSILG